MSGLPTGWVETTIGSVISPAGERSTPGADDARHYIGLEHIEAHTTRILGSQLASQIRSSAVSFQKDSVLYGRMRPYLNKVCLAPFDGIGSPELIVLPPSLGIRPRFLLYRISHTDFVSFAMKHIEGDRPRVKWNQLADFPIDLPPVAEQDRIVAAIEEQFSRLDAAEASLQRAKRNVERMRRAVLAEAFPRGDELPTGWVEVAIGDVCRVVGGSTPKTSVDEYWDGPIPWVTPDDLSKDRSQYVTTGRRSISQAGYDSCSTQMLPPGSVLYTSRAPIGYVAIARNDLCTNQGFKSFVLPERLDSRFVYWQLIWATPMIKDLGSGTTFKEISGKVAGKIPLRVAPRAEQDRIVAAIEEQFSILDSLFAAIDHSLVRSAHLRRAILEQAFTGRLVPQNPSDEPASALLERIEQVRRDNLAASKTKKGKVATPR